MVINNDSHVNPYLPTHEEYLETLKKHKNERHRLVIPRRWVDSIWNVHQLTSKARLGLKHLSIRTGPTRKGLFLVMAAELSRVGKKSPRSTSLTASRLQDNGDLLLTPFERNIEVWRQLWRVVERSEVVVQIVDARNPLLYRCNDLETYVKEISSTKRNILLINKADLLTEDQRQVVHLLRVSSYTAERRGLPIFVTAMWISLSSPQH